MADQSGGYVNNEKGFGGPPPPQGYPVQQQGYGPNPYQQGQTQAVGPDEYIDKHGNVVKKNTRGKAFACCLFCCWCITWPCHGPCCGGL
ncbi:unnamed protein product [Calypogeia fissa]